jgi:hypothetical protein
VIRQFFSGSPQDLVLRLLEDEQLTETDLQELIQKASFRACPDRLRRVAANK